MRDGCDMTGSTPWWGPSSRGRLPARHNAPAGGRGTACVQRAAKQVPTDRQSYDILYKDMDIRVKKNGYMYVEQTDKLEESSASGM